MPTLPPPPSPIAAAQLGRCEGARRGVVGLLSPRPRRPARHRDRAGRHVPRLVRPGVRRRRRVPGAVRVLLRRQTAARRAAPRLRRCRRCPRSIRLVRRLLPALVVVLAGCAVLTILDPAADPLGDLRRPEPGQPRLLPELGAGQHGVGLPARRRGRQPAAAHLVDVGAGPVLHRVPALVFGFAVPVPRLLGSHTADRVHRAAGALTIASFVYAIFAHNADQATAYYNSFARAWELLLGALVGALVPYVRWPMWLRTAVAAVALAAILSCGALIDGVKEFPGPWALVPVGATMLFILAGANRQGRSAPAVGCRCPNRLLAAAPFVSLGRDGLLAVPVALAAADLLAGLHRPRARRLRRGHGVSAGVGRAGAT